MIVKLYIYIFTPRNAYSSTSIDASEAVFWSFMYIFLWKKKAPILLTKDLIFTLLVFIPS